MTCRPEQAHHSPAVAPHWALVSTPPCADLNGTLGHSELAVAVLFLLRAGVADLDRALVREPAVVVLVVHDLAPLPEPSGQPVRLSLTLQTVTAHAGMRFELRKQR